MSAANPTAGWTICWRRRHLAGKVEFLLRFECGKHTADQEGTAIFYTPKHFDFLARQLTAEADGNEIAVHTSAFARQVWVESDDPDLLLSVSLSTMYARHVPYTHLYTCFQVLACGMCKKVKKVTIFQKTLAFLIQSRYDSTNKNVHSLVKQMFLEVS